MSALQPPLRSILPRLLVLLRLSVMKPWPGVKFVAPTADGGEGGGFEGGCAEDASIRTSCSGASGSRRNQ
jgi:hypothetical protein